jgi:hypothetical protein
MFQTPARKAQATASPVKMKGTDRTRVIEKNASRLPNAPDTMAPAARTGS